MTSKERLRTAIRLQEADRVPCSPHVTGVMIDKMTDAEWEALRANTDVTMIAGGGPGDLGIFGGRYVQEHIRKERRGNVERTTVETPKGALHAERVYTHASGWQTEYLCKSSADARALLSIPFSIPEIDVAGYHSAVETIGADGLTFLGIPSAFRLCLSVFGPERLYITMADEIDLVEQLVTTMNDHLAHYVRICCERGVRGFWMGGSEHCGPGVVNPSLFPRLVTPFDKRIVEIIHSYGGVVNYHTHAKLKDILDEIAEVGVDVMSPIETGLRGDVTLADVKGRVGDRICLKGNLDDMAFLTLASEDDVRAAAEDAIGQAAGGGGFILSGTDAGIYAPQWVTSFLVMADICRAHTY